MTAAGSQNKKNGRDRERGTGLDWWEFFNRQFHGDVPGFLVEV